MSFIVEARDFIDVTKEKIFLRDFIINESILKNIEYSPFVFREKINFFVNKKKEIIILNRNKVEKYDSSGNFIKSIKVKYEFKSFIEYNNKLYFLLCGDSSDTAGISTKGIYIYNWNGDLIKFVSYYYNGQNMIEEIKTGNYITKYNFRSHFLMDFIITKDNIFSILVNKQGVGYDINNKYAGQAYSLFVYNYANEKMINNWELENNVSLTASDVSFSKDGFVYGLYNDDNNPYFKKLKIYSIWGDKIEDIFLLEHPSRIELIGVDTNNNVYLAFFNTQEPIEIEPICAGSEKIIYQPIFNKSNHCILKTILFNNKKWNIKGKIIILDSELFGNYYKAKIGEDGYIYYTNVEILKDSVQGLVFNKIKILI